jgi:hypothetical protein
MHPAIAPAIVPEQEAIMDPTPSAWTDADRSSARAPGCAGFAGEGHAPVAGRMVTVPLTMGTAVLNGNTIATIGEQPFMLRLCIPERHAVLLKVGCPLRVLRDLRFHFASCRTTALRRTGAVSKESGTANHAEHANGYRRGQG